MPFWETEPRAIKGRREGREGREKKDNRKWGNNRLDKKGGRHRIIFKFRDDVPLIGERFDFRFYF